MFILLLYNIYIINMYYFNNIFIIIFVSISLCFMLYFIILVLLLAHMIVCLHL